MDELADKGLLANGSRVDLLRNRLVLVTPKDLGTLHDFAGLADSGVRLIALGEPASVPAGDYGKQVLQSLGLWQKVEHKLVLAKDVRQVLSYVETGNADAGLVYLSDAQTSSSVRIVATASETSHKPITYPVAVLKENRNPDAATAFVGFLRTAEAADAFRQHGFAVAMP